jgi:hypothetical protein
MQFIDSWTWLLTTLLVFGAPLAVRHTRCDWTAELCRELSSGSEWLMRKYSGTVSPRYCQKPLPPQMLIPWRNANAPPDRCNNAAVVREANKTAESRFRGDWLGDHLAPRTDRCQHLVHHTEARPDRGTR